MSGVISEALLLEYKELQDNLTIAKEREMAIRKEIASKLLEGKEPGAHSLTFGNVMVKVTRSMSYSLDTDKLVELQSKMSNAELMAIQLKPQLSLTEYKKIPYDDRKTLDECVVVKDAAPTIKIVIGDHNDD